MVGKRIHEGIGDDGGYDNRLREPAGVSLSWLCLNTARRREGIPFSESERSAVTGP